MCAHVSSTHISRCIILIHTHIHTSTHVCVSLSLSLNFLMFHLRFLFLRKKGSKQGIEDLYCPVLVPFLTCIVGYNGSLKVLFDKDH